MGMFKKGLGILGTFFAISVLRQSLAGLQEKVSAEQPDGREGRRLEAARLTVDLLKVHAESISLLYGKELSRLEMLQFNLDDVKRSAVETEEMLAGRDGLMYSESLIFEARIDRMRMRCSLLKETLATIRSLEDDEKLSKENSNETDESI